MLARTAMSRASTMNTNRHTPQMSQQAEFFNRSRYVDAGQKLPEDAFEKVHVFGASWMIQLKDPSMLTEEQLAIWKQRKIKANLGLLVYAGTLIGGLTLLEDYCKSDSQSDDEQSNVRPGR